MADTDPLAEEWYAEQARAAKRMWEGMTAPDPLAKAMAEAARYADAFTRANEAVFARESALAASQAEVERLRSNMRQAVREFEALARSHDHRGFSSVGDAWATAARIVNEYLGETDG